KLRPVTYNYDVDAIEAFYGRVVPEGLRRGADAKNNMRFTGFIAQEVETAANSSGFEFSGVDAPSGGSEAYGLRYAEFVVPLVKATQELSKKVKDQEAVINNQQALLERYEASLKSVKTEMNVLRAQVNANTAASGYSQSK
ncbi:MAG: hypothetical protein ACI9UR_002122, partial [Bacteroidia bacterium]